MRNRNGELLTLERFTAHYIVGWMHVAKGVVYGFFSFLLS